MNEHPQTSPRRPEGVETRPMGWWGMLLAAAVVLTVYAALYFTYVYVRVASDHWPPAGIDRPALGVPALAALALLASAPPIGWATRGAVRGTWGRARAGLALALLLAGAHLALLISDWQGQAFTVDQHAYGSLFFVLPGMHAVALGLGMLVAAVLLALTWHDEGPSLVHVGTMSLRVYWYATVFGGVILLAVVYLLPHVWREAISA